PDGSGALLLDGDEVLEAGWANVFAVRDGVLRTPPLDGRILPGTTRRTVLRIAAEEDLEVAEEPLSREDLLAAGEVFLTGSVRGVEGAVELDGAPLAGRGELSRRVAAELRRRWRLPEPRAAAPVPAGGPRPGRSAR
ncbi:MAG TPA: aminotransferase class IV, partial [Solirubrobacterales bacterium]|nr:aminotransferase class IV [Solirubrobacterales bacterium]